MTGWLPEGTARWGGRPVARSVSDAAPRCRAVLSGTIGSVRTRSQSDAAVEAVLSDGTGALTLMWLGREQVPGIAPGATVSVEGTVLDRRGRLVLLNPLYRFNPPAAYSSTSW